MAYALTITLAAALAMLALVALAYLLARRAVAAGGIGDIGGWRWFPSPLGVLLLIALPVAGLVLFRFFPVFLILPFVVPFIMRGRFRVGSFFRRRAPDRGDNTVDGDLRSLRDD
jgi:hypothetical protein